MSGIILVMANQWKNIGEFLEERAHSCANNIAMSIYKNEAWQTLSYQELLNRSQKCARRLYQSGLRPNERVAILADASIEWPIHFFAVLLTGAVVIPLDTKLSEQELQKILAHVEPKILLVETKYLITASALRHRSTSIEKVLVMDEAALQFPFDLEEVKLDEGPIANTAAIYYTSGTDGEPKGVMTSKAALLFEVETLSKIEKKVGDEVTFSILPLSHLYGLTGGLLYSLGRGGEYCFAHSLAPPDIFFCLNERRVTQISTVPLLMNLLRRGIERKFNEEPSRARKILLRFLLLIAPLLPLSGRRKLFRPIHKRLGGSLKRVISGAAALDLSTYKFFRTLGIPIYTGYGLTETGPVLTVNDTRNVRKGTVGIPLPGIEIKIMKENPQDIFGEIWTKGPNLMQGYYRNQELTDKVMQDGWFKTGDLGFLDGDGYLEITGRQKNLIVLESGKKVQPEEVELLLQKSSHFQDLCVLGLATSRGGEQVAAIVFPAKELLAEFEGRTEQLQKKMEQLVGDLTKEIAQFKQPSQVILRLRPFPKTSSEKIKRHRVLAELSI